MNNLIEKFLVFLKLKLAMRIQLVPHYRNHFINFLLMAYRHYIKKYSPLTRSLVSKSVMIALTYRCQCSCGHCGIALDKQKQGKELKNWEVMKLIDQIKNFGAINFFGGEPLLVHELINYVIYAKQKGLTVRLDTNGFLLDENMVKKLKEAGVDLIGISIDSPFEDVHDKLRGIKGIFRKAIAGIKYCKKYNIRCYISTYATKKNLKNGELKKIINLAKSLNVKTRILSPICSGNWSNRNDLILSPKEIILLRNLLERNEVYWDAEDVDGKEIPFRCPAFEKNFFYISAYGDVRPCCYSQINFGNIRKESLKNIMNRMWSSDVFINYNGYNDCPLNYKVFKKGNIKL